MQFTLHSFENWALQVKVQGVGDTRLEFNCVVLFWFHLAVESHGVKLQAFWLPVAEIQRPEGEMDVE